MFRDICRKIAGFVLLIGIVGAVFVATPAIDYDMDAGITPFCIEDPDRGEDN